MNSTEREEKRAAALAQAADAHANGLEVLDVFERVLAVAAGPTNTRLPAHHPRTQEAQLVVTSLADVEQQDTDWLWHRWLPRGKFLLLGGHAGDGKSTLMAALAAAGSRGNAWPDGSPVLRPLRFLFLLGEDAAADTLKPRLAVHNAAMDLVFTIDAILDERGKERGFDVRKHLELLEKAVLAYGIDVIVIDPLTTVMPGADRNAEGDTRDLLTPLVKMAERLSVAIVGIVHVGKSESGRRAAQKILGATAFIALARIVWMIAPAPDGGRVLGVVKSNLAVKPDPIAWDREEDGPIVWHGVASQGIEELLSALPVSTPRVDAEGFLREYLGGGAKPSREVEDAAKQRGISMATLRRAREAVCEKPEKLDFNGAWYWRLVATTDVPSPKMLTSLDTQVNTFADSKTLTTVQGEHLAEITPLFGHIDQITALTVIEDVHEDAHPGVYGSEHLRFVPAGDPSAGGEEGDL